MYSFKIKCDGCEEKNCKTIPNVPRSSLDGTKAIVTGIFLKAPEAVYITQEEAIKLMNTPEWKEDHID